MAAAEYFCKELISKMRISNQTKLKTGEYWLIDDKWKSEYKKGVQIPVSEKPLHEPAFREVMPRPFETDHYKIETLDSNWLKEFNFSRNEFGLQEIEETLFENIYENFEDQAYVSFLLAIKHAKCDVCRSPDSHEMNKVVVCDSCNTYVHEICYGITKIPEGRFKCQSCVLGIEPACVLCPSRGGAVKTTSNRKISVHVSCAVWIPEVSYNNSVEMEPIIDISQVPAWRWSLTCTLCNEEFGACLTCSEKDCKIAFHVTCALNKGLQMEVSVNFSCEKEVKAFCQIHSQKKRYVYTNLDEDPNKKDSSSSEERTDFEPKKIQDLEDEFCNYVEHINIEDMNIEKVSERLKCDEDVIGFIFLYWKMKIMANTNGGILLKNKPALCDKADAKEFSGEDGPSLKSPPRKRVKVLANLVDDCPSIEVKIGVNSSNSPIVCSDCPTARKTSPG